MAYHNSADGYFGAQPTIPAYPSAVSGASPHERDGLFYRSDITVDAVELAGKLLAADETVCIQDYQYWTEQGWKAEHGTYAAVTRFGEKLYEEQWELAEAVRALLDSEATSGAPHPEQDSLRSAVIQEAGDELWCATALACASTADIDSGLKNLLFRYLMGVQHIQRGEAIEPAWRSEAARLATKYDQLTFADLNQLVKAGFEPLGSPVMNVFHPESDQYDAEDHLLNMLGLAAAIRNVTESQYGWGHELGVPGIIDPTVFKEHARSVGELVAGAYLEVAFVVDRVAQGSLSEVVAVNVEKLSQRIQEGSIDKSDRSRSSVE